MNIKLNDFVKKMTFGYYTVFLKDEIRMLVHVNAGRLISTHPIAETPIRMTGVEFQEEFGDDIVDVRFGLHTPIGHMVNKKLTRKLEDGSTGSLMEYGSDDLYDFFVSEMYIGGEDILVMTYYTDKDNLKSCNLEIMEDRVMAYYGVQI